MLEKMSRREGKKYDSSKSRKDIAKFVQQYNIDMSEAKKAVDEFDNFNDFFARRLRKGARPIAYKSNPAVVVSPADCRCVIFPNFHDGTRIWVKGANFSIATLLDDDKLAAKFKVRAGAALVCCAAVCVMH